MTVKDLVKVVSQIVYIQIQEQDRGHSRRVYPITCSYGI